MAKPPGGGRAPQPRRPAGAAGGRGGQWSPKPAADPPSSGGMHLGEDGAHDPLAPVDVQEPHSGRQPTRRPGGPSKLKLAGPRVYGRRLQVTVRRDPDPGAWVNPTMFGDETFRTLSDTPWEQGGAEEAKGLHAQVFVDMLNAGDARPCPEHAQAALRGTQEAGLKWAGSGWSIAQRYEQGSADCAMLEMAAATRAETYFRDRLLLWGGALSGPGLRNDYPILSTYVFPAELWGGGLWQGEDGRLMERLAMLEDNTGRSVMDRWWQVCEDTHPIRSGIQLPVFLLKNPDLDETVKKQCFGMLELAAQNRSGNSDWVKLLQRIANAEHEDCRFSDTVLSILRHYGRDNYHPVKDTIANALTRVRRLGWYPDSELVTSDAIKAEIDQHFGSEAYR